MVYWILRRSRRQLHGQARRGFAQLSHSEVGGSCSGRTTERRTRRSGGVSWWKRGRESCNAYRSVIGLSNQSIIALAVNLQNSRALGIEPRVYRKSREESRSGNGNSSGVDHLGGIGVTTIEAVAAGKRINASKER